MSDAVVVYKGIHHNTSIPKEKAMLLTEGDRVKFRDVECVVIYARHIGDTYYISIRELSKDVYTII